MSGKLEMAICEWSQVSCKGDFLGILLFGAESPLLSVTIAIAGMQICLNSVHDWIADVFYATGTIGTE